MGTLAEQILKEAIAAHRRQATQDAKRLYRRALGLDPGSEIACSNLAIIAAQEGDLALAETLFRQAVALRPNDAAGFYNLATLLAQQARLDEAIAALRQAIGLRQDYAAAHFGLGNALKQQGRLDEARAAFGRTLELEPDHVAARSNTGVVLALQGQLDDAMLAYREAIRRQPRYAEAHYNLAVALQARGDLAAATRAYREAIRLRPDSADAYNNLGTALQEQGLIEAAIAAYQQAIAASPGNAQAHYNHGVLLAQQGRNEEALVAYRQAIVLQPDHVDALNNSGIVLQEQGRADDAARAFRQVIALRPAHAEAHNNLGIALLAAGRPDEAATLFRQASALKPGHAEALRNLGNSLRETGDLAGAIAAYERALQLRPDDAEAFGQLLYCRRRACDWTDDAASERKLLDLVRQDAAPVPPFLLVATHATAADQLRAAQRWSGLLACPPQQIFRHAPAPKSISPPSRIRLGYLSADFHQHATAQLTAELFEVHDRSRFEVIAYSYGPDDASPLRQRLARAFDRFVDIRALPHRDAAERIHADRIDILVDLKGHTANARAKILAYRPAPIQVHYLGYPGTTGAGCIDYLLVDRCIVPPGERAGYSEKLAYLPVSYQVNDSKRDIAASTPARAECGLPRDGFVFCCFNNSFKITPALFAIWMRLLAQVEGSVLWLMAANDLVPGNLRAAAIARGVDPARLVFAPPLPAAEHLARQRHADLFLDTLPCNAHTTASDALWAGLPLVTCRGETFAGRVAGSLLTAIGLAELITGSLADYETLALALARDPARLAGLRERLARQRTTAALFDIRRFAKNIEAAYARMWEIWCAGQDPREFSVEDM